MLKYGGFEGNAQTLRIISKLEKKSASPSGERFGLNLCYRTLASALKYDQAIPLIREERGIKKGYYHTEARLVENIKRHVTGNPKLTSKFKSIECSIMDVADDIAYSTYDLDDSFKAGFLSPADMLVSSEKLLSKIASKVAKNEPEFQGIDESLVARTLLNIFDKTIDAREELSSIGILQNSMRSSQKLTQDGYNRTLFTSELVDEFVKGVSVELNEENPSLSRVYLNDDTRLKVEVLKNYTFQATIQSTKLKITEFRGYEIVQGIFDALSGDKGNLILPEDVKLIHEKHQDNQTAIMRTVCDFIAGMTDRYAIEFYGRLKSNTPQTIFKPI